MENCIGTVPIHLKMTLTTKEAAEYSNIGINKIDSMLRSPNCPFVLFVGTKSWSSVGSLNSTSAVQWQFEGKFTIEKRKSLCYNYKMYRGFFS